jgi:hypothetical protein
MSRVGREDPEALLDFLADVKRSFWRAETHPHLNAMLELMARERIVAEDWNLIRNCCLSSMKCWMLPHFRANKDSMIP